jgi:hypothetical protein
MRRAFSELPGWSFEVTERSAGVYHATGTDAVGHQVQSTGTDSDALLDECRGMAAKIVAELGRRR